MEYEETIKTIGQLQKKYTFEPISKGPNSERATVIQDFVDEINRQRKGTAYRPVTWGQINGQLAHVKRLPDLYYFLSVCRQAKNFSKCFWGSLKVRD